MGRDSGLTDRNNRVRRTGSATSPLDPLRTRLIAYRKVQSGAKQLPSESNGGWRADGDLQIDGELQIKAPQINSKPLGNGIENPVRPIRCETQP